MSVFLTPSLKTVHEFQVNSKGGTMYNLNLCHVQNALGFLYVLVKFAPFPSPYFFSRFYRSELVRNCWFVRCI